MVAFVILVEVIALVVLIAIVLLRHLGEVGVGEQLERQLKSLLDFDKHLHIDKAID